MTSLLHPEMRACQALLIFVLLLIVGWSIREREDKKTTHSGGVRLFFLSPWIGTGHYPEKAPGTEISVKLPFSGCPLRVRPSGGP
jgi:hypothetical protein